MPTVDFEQLRAQGLSFTQRLLAHPDVEVMVVAVLLAVVVLLSLLTIWRGRSHAAAVAALPASTPSQASGFRRWLTPMGMQSIPAEQAVVVRPHRRSGSNKTIRVSTPVSKVPARALKARGADALEIARRSGLARDAVMMMMANADPRAHAQRVSAAKAAAAPTLAPRTAAGERGMSAPGAGAAPGAARAQAPSGERTLGTQFNARVG